jgi:hypothetical protein
MKQWVVLSAACALSLAAADFSYVERVEVTGGSLKKFLSIAGGTKPTTQTVSFSGGRMSSRDEDSNSILDADAGTMIAVDYKKKEFSVITFEEMKAAMQKMGEMMQQQKKDASVKTELKVNVTDKGAGPEVVGIPTRLFEMTIDTVSKIEARDNKGQQQQVNMTSSMKSDTAMGKVPGSQAVRDFALRLAGKNFMRPGPMMQAMAQAGITVDMASEGMKKMAEMDGLSLRATTQLLSQGMGGPAMPKISAGDLVSGALGGFGGFGKKKKTEEPPPAQSGPPAPSVLLEMTSEMQSFSSAAVDPAVFTVPANFKQVEHPMKKMLNKK